MGSEEGAEIITYLLSFATAKWNNGFCFGQGALGVPVVHSHETLLKELDASNNKFWVDQGQRTGLGRRHCECIYGSVGPVRAQNPQRVEWAKEGTDDSLPAGHIEKIPCDFWSLLKHPQNDSKGIKKRKKPQNPQRQRMRVQKRRASEINLHHSKSWKAEEQVIPVNLSYLWEKAKNMLHTAKKRAKFPSITQKRLKNERLLVPLEVKIPVGLHVQESWF